MKPRTLLKTGIVSTTIALVCCFTPALVILFGTLGLSAYVGMLDFVLLPLLAISLILTGFALWKFKKAA
jgi:mercuric ion transport protein